MYHKQQILRFLFEKVHPSQSQRLTLIPKTLILILKGNVTLRLGKMALLKYRQNINATHV
jgi:hypothetical protein